MVNKNCKTCEFNFDGVCADANYGQKITGESSQRECWSVGLGYLSELVDKLPEEIRKDYIHNFSTKLAVEDIIKYFENEVHSDK